jgi:hypothetical protein
MESKWSRLRMILTVTCGNDCHQCHITWLGRYTDDILLGVFQAVSSKGSDQADVILNLLEQYDIVDQTFAVCCDTTSSNTSVFSGAIVLLCTILNTPLLWFPCRRHMLAVNISHFIHWRKDQGPLGGCVSNFRRSGQQSRMRLKTL